MTSREDKDWDDKVHAHCQAQITELRATVSRLEVENEELRHAISGRTVSCVCGGQGEIDRLRSRLAVLERVREAAENFISIDRRTGNHGDVISRGSGIALSLAIGDIEESLAAARGKEEGER